MVVDEFTKVARPVNVGDAAPALLLKVVQSLPARSPVTPEAAMLKSEEVASAVGTAEPLPMFAKTELPAIAASAKEGLDAPRTGNAVQEMPDLQVAEEVATLPIAPVPLPKRSWPPVKEVWPVPPFETVSALPSARRGFN